MVSQRELLHEGNWKLLIVLDACRYDTFEKHYIKYFNGVLIKVHSIATNTPEWIRKTFDEYMEDVIYVSANPFINSREYEGKLFYKVINVWHREWDNCLRCVPPWGMNKVVKEVLTSYPGKRIIAHYLQPHAPYLVLPTPASFFDALKRISSWKSKFKFIVNRSKASLIWRLAKVFKASIKFVKVNDFLIDYTLALVGEKGLREVYEANLEIVLSYVSLLINDLKHKHIISEKDTIIITSDHGELLGEHNEYGHWPPKRRNYKELTEVPWLTILRVKYMSPFSPYDNTLYNALRLKYMLHIKSKRDV